MSVSDRTAEIDPERTLRERFGLERFRPGQREVIDAVLGGRDVLCVMPTGGGKSLCYQLPALVMEGLTLVVSPLIALMKDQVDALRARGMRATLINSTLDPDEQRARLMEAEAGRYDLLYVAPERFRSHRFVETMARLRPALFAVDEAHCISEWGHDFRPDYARLGLARRKLGMPPCIALTATATDLVRRDIAEQLDLREPAQFITGFDRPNLAYAVVEARRDADKCEELARLLRRTSGSVVVYASSRKRCESVAAFIGEDLRRSVVCYHAGLDREHRHAAQEAFMNGDVDVIVATNAFGMGVDKPDIRAVVHFNIPGTLEAYYQEAGRAGRDGLPADCLLLYAPGDRKLQQLFIESEYPPREVVFQVYEYLRHVDADPIELTQAEIREALGLELSESAVGSALKILEGAGALERFSPRENMAIVRVDREPDEPPLADRVGAQAPVQKLVMIGLEGLCDRRLGEPVYFHPDEFASALGIDRTALNRALKLLTAELPVTYVPPFRGNAVRILDRSRRAKHLEIDFSALEKRKRSEYEKLDRMIGYAEARRCRRAVILGYFGDPHPSNCGRCDCCAGGGDGGDGEPCVVDTPAAREVVLKVLSGVARAKGRFGKTIVAQMLAGSGSEKMNRFGLTRLSTFGILGDFTQQELAQLIDALTQAGLIESEEVDRFKTVVTLAEPGWAYLKELGEGGPPIVLFGLPGPLAFKLRTGGLRRVEPSSRPGESAPIPGPNGADDEQGEDSGVSWPAEDPAGITPPSRSADDEALIQKLRALRSAWAREAGLSPGYVLANETLEQLVRHRPRTPQEIAAIKGIGPAKLERYGSALLEAITGTSGGPTPPANGDPARPTSDDGTFPTAEPAPIERHAPQAPSGGTDPVGTSGVAQEEWTGRLLDRGFSAEEASAIRGLELDTIIGHATQLARRGRAVPLDAFLPSEVVRRWEGWLADRKPDLPPDAGHRAGLWDLFLACRGQILPDSEPDSDPNPAP
ncbi:ATP-dependent DNA helicase RecQ [Tautonia sociabilis]|uniref:ATP-dependent DNA helicase RecQ n=1 Tax=Tautonia sociabilis TaxID=2080755 RepID=A0A432MFV6_9BACT|nr:ATP-dependent DNA helicase RecQ [Tautonia sociabilis]RUL85005.1 RecQ family ATP-dependent DNA helicase [Tautonia sociabilis]